MDVCDGLVVDGTWMPTASRVLLEVDPALLRADLTALAGPAQVAGHDAMEWVLRGPSRAVLPQPFRPLGVVGAVEIGGRPRVRLGGRDVHGGWDHFRR